MEIARVFVQLTATTGAPAGLLEDYADFLLTVEPESLRDLPRALALATRAIDTSKRRLFGPLRTAAMAHEALGRPDQAIRLLQESLALPDALPSWTTEARLVRLLRQAGRDVEAERALIERLERFRAARGPDERLAFRTMQHLARLCEDQRRIADAERWWRDALAQLERTTPEPNFQVGLARADLGVFLIGQARYGEAEPLLRSAFDLLGDRRRVSPSARVRVRDALARTYAALGKPRDAAAWRGRGVD
jgi:tetratricopeptide (TPR) repeat protein